MITSFAGVESVGLAVLTAGMILSNVAVSKMARLVHIRFHVAGGGRVFAADRLSQRNAIRMYRAEYGNGPLFRNLVIAYALAGIGFLVVIFGRFVLKS